MMNRDLCANSERAKARNIELIEAGGILLIERQCPTLPYRRSRGPVFPDVRNGALLLSPGVAAISRCAADQIQMKTRSAATRARRNPDPCRRSRNCVSRRRGLGFTAGRTIARTSLQRRSCRSKFDEGRTLQAIGCAALRSRDLAIDGQATPAASYTHAKFRSAL
jgi:hypothetical protein